MIALLAGLVTFGFTAVLTIAGVGAAFILIPVFLALGIELHAAMATALLLNAVAMSVASVNFVRKKLVVWDVTLPILVVASALSPLGAYVSQGIDRTILLWLFIAFLAFAALMMMFYRPRLREKLGGRALLLAIGTGVGGLAGFLGGLLGVGGGNIVVPALVALGFDPKKASASICGGDFLVAGRLSRARNARRPRRPAAGRDSDGVGGRRRPGVMADD